LLGQTLLLQDQLLKFMGVANTTVRLLKLEVALSNMTVCPKQMLEVQLAHWSALATS
jgi:hypothetical protein